MIILHVQHVSAARISHGRAVRLSIRLSVRRVQVPYYMRHMCVSSDFLLVMCIVVDNDIRLVPSVVTQKGTTQLVMILDISYFCSHGFIGVLTRVLVTIDYCC